MDGLRRCNGCDFVDFDERLAFGSAYQKAGRGVSCAIAQRDTITDGKTKYADVMRFVLPKRGMRADDKRWVSDERRACCGLL
jgi:hypothetical protein